MATIVSELPRTSLGTQNPYVFTGYIGNDHPETWSINRPRVLGAFDNSNRYHLSSPEGIAEWASLTPPSGGVVHLGKAEAPFTISMIHQLRCLDIVRDHFVSNATRRVEATPLTRHCLNYIRQVVMCRADIQLEPFRSALHDKSPIDLNGIYECNDWEAVYNEIERNRRVHERRRSEVDT
jgi:hypothetical protein